MAISHCTPTLTTAVSLLFPPTLTTKHSLLFISCRTIFSPFAQLVTQGQSQGFLSSQGFVRYESRESCLSVRKWGEASRKSLHLFLHSALLQGKPQSEMDSAYTLVCAGKVVLLP